MGGESSYRDSGVQHRRHSSAVEVEKAILFRIGSGLYSYDQRIPTCGQLATELGVNKNTVSKAYRSLAEQGYLRSNGSRGTFIAKRPGQVDPQRAVDEISRLLALVVQEAKLAGIPRELFKELIEQTTESYYERVRPLVGFIECSRRDAAALSRDLHAMLSHPIEPLLIDDVMASPDRYVSRFDILAVALTHLAAVEGAIRRVHGEHQAKVVGLLIPPDVDCLTQVARLRAGTKLGIVCDLDDTLQALRGLVRGYNPGVSVMTCLTHDEPSLQKTLKEADVLLVTLSASDRVLALAPEVPVITALFKVDERSVQQLGALIGAQIRGGLGKAPAAHLHSYAGGETE